MDVNLQKTKSNTFAEQAIGWISRIASNEATRGIILLAAALIALIWVNTPWGSSYHLLWQTSLSINWGGMTASDTLAHVVNGGLLVIFFLEQGLIIKREVLAGRLSSPSRAALPVVAALGGMIFPAIIYLLLNLGSKGLHGWAIPTVTDMAFATSIIVMLGKRIPSNLVVTLQALAIADSVGGIVIIAFFYANHISFLYLGITAAIVALMILTNWLGFRNLLIYIFLGILLWAAVTLSGIQPILAGVLVGLIVPLRPKLNSKQLDGRAKNILGKIDQARSQGQEARSNSTLEQAIRELEQVSTEAEPPLKHLEQTLKPWITFIILPVFALANAGITLNSHLLSSFFNPITLGVLLGLAIGKPMGISVASVVVVKAGIGKKPPGTSWFEIVGMAWLAGIGFTVSLLIASLAFQGNQQAEYAKMGILAGSALSAIIGMVLLYLLASRSKSKSGSSQK